MPTDESVIMPKLNVENVVDAIVYVLSTPPSVNVSLFWLYALYCIWQGKVREGNLVLSLSVLYASPKFRDIAVEWRILKLCFALLPKPANHSFTPFSSKSNPISGIETENQTRFGNRTRSIGPIMNYVIIKKS